MGLKIMSISIFHMSFIETCHSWQPYIDHKRLFKNIQKKIAALYTVHTFNFYITCTLSAN